MLGIGVLSRETGCHIETIRYLKSWGCCTNRNAPAAVIACTAAPTKSAWGLF